MLPWVRWLHLVAAATWLGGAITLGFLVVALRRQNVDRSVLQAVARMFARVSWMAMAVAVATGVTQVEVLHLPWTHSPLLYKLGIVAVTVALTAVHQRLAKHLTGASRGALEAALLISSLAIFWAAGRI
jgi:uncharacterized membrane protein